MVSGGIQLSQLELQTTNCSSSCQQRLRGAQQAQNMTNTRPVLWAVAQISSSQQAYHTFQTRTTAHKRLAACVHWQRRSTGRDPLHASRTQGIEEPICTKQPRRCMQRAQAKQQTRSECLSYHTQCVLQACSIIHQPSLQQLELGEANMQHCMCDVDSGPELAKVHLCACRQLSCQMHANTWHILHELTVVPSSW